MLIVEYNRAACAASPTVRGAAPKAIKPRVRANWVSKDHISPILSNWLNQIMPPNPDMSIKADMSICDQESVGVSGSNSTRSPNTAKRNLHLRVNPACEGPGKTVQFRGLVFDLIFSVKTRPGTI